MLNDCRCICHFGCGHLHHVVQAPSPAPRECAQHPRSTKQDSCVNMWVVNCTACTPCVKDSETTQPTVQQAHAQERYEQVLSLLKCTYASVLLNSTTARAKCLLIIMRQNRGAEALPMMMMKYCRKTNITLPEKLLEVKRLFPQLRYSTECSVSSPHWFD